jgi:hypothetical protein
MQRTSTNDFQLGCIPQHRHLLVASRYKPRTIDIGSADCPMEDTNPRHRTYGGRADPVTHGQSEALYLWGRGMFSGLNALLLCRNGSNW